MNSATSVRRYTLEEYLAMEPEGKVRHEFINGEVFAMVGASLRHNLIVTNWVAALHAHLRGTSCQVVANDRKVLIAAVDRVYYPDVMVRCDDASNNIDDYTETNPLLIVEVLSSSTAAVDRRQKRLDYQMLDSLQDYVLVDQTTATVEVYSRQREGWTVTTYGAGDEVVLPSIDYQLPMVVIYENIPLVSGDDDTD
jgi:Uma2 family endonuclease